MGGRGGGGGRTGGGGEGAAAGLRVFICPCAPRRARGCATAVAPAQLCCNSAIWLTVRWLHETISLDYIEEPGVDPGTYGL